MYKIHSSRIREAGWNLTLPISEARENGEVIALADSQILRWIDELNANEDADNKAKEIKRRISALKKENNENSKKELRQLYNELDKTLYYRDYLELIIDKNSDYWKACKGFKINNLTYKRLLGTNSGIKNSTIVFVSARLYPKLAARIENGRDPTKPFVTAKLEAYKALVCTASNPLSRPNGLLVVDDVYTKFKDDVIYIADSPGDGEPIVTEIKNYEVELDASDGFGLMSPDLAARWSMDLGLDYVMAGCNTRFSWEKGMVYCFDFHEFAEQIAGNYIVTDAWGDKHDIRDIDLILTTSMVKLWDSYESVDHYLEESYSNGYEFASPKCCPKQLESERNLNYQFVQSYELTDDDVEELVAPTINEIREILEGDWVKTVLYLKGVGLNTENIYNQEDDIAKVIEIDNRVINDPYVQSMIYKTIKNRIKEAERGEITVHGNYSLASGDPFALCQNIFGLEVTGLLKAGEIYNRYWRDTPEVVCFRAPMSCHNNICKFSPANREDVNYWYQYMDTCTILNAWDTSMQRLNGCDLNKVLLYRNMQVESGEPVNAGCVSRCLC